MRLAVFWLGVVTVSCVSCFAVCVRGAEQVAEKLKVGEGMLYPEVRKYVEQRVGEFGMIPGERKKELEKIAVYVRERVSKNQPAKLTFICTHNSRRSHLSQIWSAVAAEYYGVRNVETYSGGTEGTAFNPRAVGAIERAGLKVTRKDESKNPRYEVGYRTEGEDLICFSKVYNESPNPMEDFCAVMTCSQADKNCPIVQGSSLRVAIPYDDPKEADNTPEEAARYDERSAQICREMLYLFSVVRGSN